MCIRRHIYLFLTHMLLKGQYNINKNFQKCKYVSIVLNSLTHFILTLYLGDLFEWSNADWRNAYLVLSNHTLLKEQLGNFTSTAAFSNLKEREWEKRHKAKFQSLEIVVIDLAHQRKKRKKNQNSTVKIAWGAC